jgi:hypothetical protein
MSAIIEDQVDEVREILASGGDPNGEDEAGRPMLTVAATMGRSECVQVLLENGAEVDGRAADEGTALISAAFFGRTQSVKVLLAAGADVEAQDSKGTTALDAATMDFGIVKAVARMIAVPVGEGMAERRNEVAQILIDEGGVRNEKKEGELMDLYWLGVFWPIFHHLWFLYDLMWLLVIFLPGYRVVRRLGWRLPDVAVSVPWCLLWVVPLTWWFQSGMPGTFGPGTSTGLFPWGAKLAYYGIFFFFGATCYGRGIWETRVARIWWVWLLAAMPLFWFGRQWVRAVEPAAGYLLASLYCWVMIIGMMGFFRRFLNGGQPKVRYLSDSAYWLYLAHLPVMMAVQILISGWGLPLVLKLVIVIGGVTAVLLVIYELVVRYSWIGAILNGRKYRTPPLPEETTS